MEIYADPLDAHTSPAERAKYLLSLEWSTRESADVPGAFEVVAGQSTVLPWKAASASLAVARCENNLLKIAAAAAFKRD